MKPPHPTTDFLRRLHRQARGMLLAWSLFATLAALVVTLASRLGWLGGSVGWPLALMAIALGLLVAWFRRVRHLTPREIANEMDQQWRLHARLETAVELSEHDSPWAQAQRDDTTARLSGRTPPGGVAWRAGIALACLMAGIAALESGWLAWRSRPESPPTPPAAKKEAPPAIDGHATIVWKSPRSESRATPIEEVPLLALADTSMGLRSASLEITINGDRELSQPIDGEALGESASSGAHELKPSLALDTLQVQDGDIIAYRIVGELNTPKPQTVSSPLQFIEARRPRPPPPSGGRGSTSEIVRLLIELKTRQVQLLKQNFTLQELAGPKSDPGWATENTRVADEQKALGPTIDRLAGLIRTANGPAEALEKLDAANREVAEAAKGIAAGENEQATKPQGRALAIFTDLAKEIQQASAASSEPAPSDPFASSELPPRENTPAGQLEKLAAQEAQASAQLGATGDESAAKDALDALAEAQTKIAEASEALLLNETLDPSAREALRAGGDAAGGAARSLTGGHDVRTARLHTGVALRAFEQAVEAQEKTGRAGAVAELEQVRRLLNEASRASAGERTQKLATARSTLRAAAEYQQRSGSAEAARELASVAEFAGNAAATKGGGPTTAADSTERAREAALAAARAQVSLTPRAAATSRAVRLLQGSTPGTAPGNSSPANLEIGAQEARWLARDTATVELAQQLITQAAAAQGAAAAPAASRDLLENAAKLATALERARSGQRDEIVRRFKPADVDPLYRPAVETYFERLSRDGGRSAAPTTK